MRPLGRAGRGGSRGPGGHECCLHDLDGRYPRRLAEFFMEGLREDLRVMYIGSGSPEAARADLAAIDDLDLLLARGAVQLASVQEVYGASGPVDPESVIAACAAATESALADGFRGLRVSADTTDLVRTAEQQDAFVRAEFLADRYMAGHPLTALCGYRLDLGGDIVREVVLLHDAGLSDEVPFRIFGCADGAVGLAGQFDPAAMSALERVLARLCSGPGIAPLVVDLGGLEYIDHRLLRALSNRARAEGVSLSLRSVPPFATQLMELLPASCMQPFTVGAEP